VIKRLLDRLYGSDERSGHGMNLENTDERAILATLRLNRRLDLGVIQFLQRQVDTACVGLILSFGHSAHINQHELVVGIEVLKLLGGEGLDDGLDREHHGRAGLGQPLHVDVYLKPRIR